MGNLEKHCMALNPDQSEQIRHMLSGMKNDPASVLQRVKAMEMLLERSIHVPGWGRKIGLDALIGLIPVVGDIITGIMGCYLIWEARNLGMSKFQLTRMVGNIGIDTLLGSVPLLGDVFDIFWRSNTRNLRIIIKHLDKHHPGSRIIEG